MPRPRMFDIEIKTAVTRQDYSALLERSAREQVPVAHLVRAAIHDLLRRDAEPLKEES